jgi:hypothetical protein
MAITLTSGQRVERKEWQLAFDIINGKGASIAAYLHLNDPFQNAQPCHANTEQPTYRAEKYGNKWYAMCGRFRVSNGFTTKRAAYQEAIQRMASDIHLEETTGAKVVQ